MMMSWILLTICSCVLVMMSSSLPTALPLTKGHVQNVFEKTKNLSNLCGFLNIPLDKWTVSSAVEYYSQRTDPRRARKMIFWLDWYGDTALADTVMECAEPPAGVCVTCTYICMIWDETLHTCTWRIMCVAH